MERSKAETIANLFNNLKKIEDLLTKIKGNSLLSITVRDEFFIGGRPVYFFDQEIEEELHHVISDTLEKKIHGLKLQVENLQ